MRGRHSSGARSVQWAEDVVDNEHLKRKKSKGDSPVPSTRHVFSREKPMPTAMFLTRRSVLHLPQAQSHGRVERGVLLIFLRLLVFRFRRRQRQA